MLTGFSLCSGTSFCQSTTVDSLERVALSMSRDSANVDVLNQIVEALREKDNNRARHFAEAASNLADSISYEKGLSIALENLGWILYRKGDFSRSLEVSTRALQISETLDNKAMVAKCLINIAAIYYEQNQIDPAIAHFRKSYAVAETIGEEQIMARCLNNIAYAYVGLNKTDSAALYAKRAIAQSEKAGIQYLVAFANRTLGDISLQQEKPMEALMYLNTCLSQSENLKNTFLKASVLHRLGNTHKILGNIDRAVYYLNENIAIAQQFGFKEELERAYKMAAEIFYAKNDLPRAYQYQSMYIALHDSLYNQRNSEQIAMLQIRFDTEMKQAQIELLTKEGELHTQELRSQRGWIYFYSTCLALFVVLALVFFMHNRNNRNAKQVLQEKNNEIERQKQQLMNLNAAKDKLFSIVSHDLRSPVASLKALMDLISNSALSQQEFMDLTKSLKRNLDSVYDDLDNLLMWAQTQLNGLQAIPEELNLQSLADEKISFFKEIARRKEVTIINDIQPEAIVWADKNHVKLIFRNLLANAIKFNNPQGTIRLNSAERSSHYEISIADSGVGIHHQDLEKLFNAETHFTTPGTQKEKGAGIGLLLTKEFVEINHGSIWVRSELDKGTTFTFTLKAAKVSQYA